MKRKPPLVRRADQSKQEKQLEIQLTDGEVEALKKLAAKAQEARAQVGALSIQEEVIRLQRLQAIQNARVLEAQFHHRLQTKAEDAGYSTVMTWDLDRKVITVR